ncbi:MAG: virulence RhuM family protein [Micrococcales bacterium]|nr:virulence RhuM family protein [Micrococcales bacterium]
MSEPATPSEILLYQRDADGLPAISVRLDGETVWLTQAQMVDLFRSSKANVSEHIRHVFDEGELEQEATVRKFRTVQAEGTREVSRDVAYYNLDVIISVGYRVRSLRGTQFRIWATQRLREYLVKGFAMDDARLKELGGGGYWRELLDRIRDIRSSEKVLYRQVLDLYATSADYDQASPTSTTFFAAVQNKLHYAAHGHTAAEVIAARADAGKPFMGLLSFTGQRPTKAEVTVAKNYLDERELQRLNTLVSAYFDAAEFRAQNHQVTYMADWLAHLDRLIVAMDAPSLEGRGTVSHREAVDKATTEYRVPRRPRRPTVRRRDRLPGVPQTRPAAHRETGRWDRLLASCLVNGGRPSPGLALRWASVPSGNVGA